MTGSRMNLKKERQDKIQESLFNLYFYDRSKNELKNAKKPENWLVDLKICDILTFLLSL